MKKCSGPDTNSLTHAVYHPHFSDCLGQGLAIVLQEKDYQNSAECAFTIDTAGSGWVSCIGFDRIFQGGCPFCWQAAWEAHYRILSSCRRTKHWMKTGITMEWAKFWAVEIEPNSHQIGEGRWQGREATKTRLCGWNFVHDRACWCPNAPSNLRVCAAGCKRTYWPAHNRR